MYYVLCSLITRYRTKWSHNCESRFVSSILGKLSRHRHFKTLKTTPLRALLVYLQWEKNQSLTRHVGDVGDLSALVNYELESSTLVNKI